MGKGLALLFKFQYPKNFEEYRKYCKEDKLKPGKVLLTEEAGCNICPCLNLNCPIKR